MTDINGQIAQAAAPGSLLRTVAEAQQQDPTKVDASAQIGSPIRNLVQQPLESVIPSTTPRVLNVTGAQNPTADFSGVHQMLSSMPVPPPHVASALIRAIMTPPAQAQGGVVAARPYVPPASINSGNPASQTSAQPAQSPSAGATPTISSTAPSISRPSNSSASIKPTSSASNEHVGNILSYNARFGAPQQTYHPAPQQHQAPQPIYQHLLGINPYIGGTIGTAGSLFSKAGGLVGRGLNAVLDNPFLDNLFLAAGSGEDF